MSQSQEIEVGFTAKVMAAARAIESRRPNALFIDPFAELLAGAEAISSAIPRLEEYEKQGRPFIAVRTRFFDDFLLNHSSCCRQVIIVGSGMDTRAFRLNWKSDTHVYEIDQASVLQYKQSCLSGMAPQCHQHLIYADLRETLWQKLLLCQGYQPSQPSLWLLEGLLYYLNQDEVENLLVTINHLSVVGSGLAADLMNPVIANGSDQWAKYWRSSCEDPESLFAHYGWKASVTQPGEPGASFGRFTYQFPDRSRADAPHIFLVTATKEL
ncbi:SAM-dependent methyltransferase [Gloeothece verrucosa]|uniref:S-adenosyl-L-methionine-dependent methyltransferase n=1 Tax=Gloeothece verrucosa (strain PCC 7822) TaxID=497965 RepID=E0UMT5_GLOV7|nr:SAM-dependent methyltransferase [Gloeothece verrucosa]ADN18265.1 methyltransferase [Gloeothece verrucosa PCC 7822]